MTHSERKDGRTQGTRGTTFRERKERESTENKAQPEARGEGLTCMELESLLLGREATTKPRQHTKKQRRWFANKVCTVKATVFPVVMYGCESWTIKKAEHRGIDAFELWCWKTLLRVPWTARRSNQLIIFLTLNICLCVLCGSDPHFLTLEPMLQSQPTFGKLLVIKVARETERDTPWAIRRPELELTCTSAHFSLVELIIFLTEHVGGRKSNLRVCCREGNGTPLQYSCL